MTMGEEDMDIGENIHPNTHHHHQPSSSHSSSLDPSITNENLYKFQQQRDQLLGTQLYSEEDDVIVQLDRKIDILSNLQS